MVSCIKIFTQLTILLVPVDSQLAGTSGWVSIRGCWIGMSGCSGSYCGSLGAMGCLPGTRRPRMGSPTRTCGTGVSGVSGYCRAMSMSPSGQPIRARLGYVLPFSDAGLKAWPPAQARFASTVSTDYPTVDGSTARNRSSKSRLVGASIVKTPSSSGIAKARTMRDFEEVSPASRSIEPSSIRCDSLIRPLREGYYTARFKPTPSQLMILSNGALTYAVTKAYSIFVST